MLHWSSKLALKLWRAVGILPEEEVGVDNLKATGIFHDPWQFQVDELGR